MVVARSIVALALVAILVGACGRGTGAGPTVTATTTYSAPSIASVMASPSPRPPGGMSQAQAIELARGHSTLVTLLSASPSSFRNLCVNARTCPGFGVKPGQQVWVVAFAGDAALCHPIMGPCASPGRGVTVVLVDYVTGEFLGACGFSLGAARATGACVFACGSPPTGPRGLAGTPGVRPPAEAVDESSPRSRL